MTEAPTPSVPNGTQIITGTGIVVSAQGQVLTNNHVIDKCRQQIEIRRADDVFRPALLLYADQANDLALLKTDASIADEDVASIRTSPPVRAGEEIAVYGFPLAGTLSSTGNIVSGNISALTGLGDDARYLQLTAPVQQGNSGGPLLDSNGAVVGVVVSKLNALSVATSTGDIPQNVNFAIKASVATSFLEAHNVGYRSASGGTKLDLPAIADVARRSTALIVCVAESIPSSSQPDAEAHTPIGTASGFYAALSRADGFGAQTFLVPEIRGHRNFEPGAMSRFYGALSESLVLLTAQQTSVDQVRVRYHFRGDSGICDGGAILTLRQVGTDLLIESIHAENGC